MEKVKCFHCKRTINTRVVWKECPRCSSPYWRAPSLWQRINAAWRGFCNPFKEYQPKTRNKTISKDYVYTKDSVKESLSNTTSSRLDPDLDGERN